MSDIVVKNARTNNLKSLNIKIPLNSITTLCGPSGSGKSSLAFHTLLAESNRRFMNSFPAKMRLFFEVPTKVDVDSIKPILPAWGLRQSNPVLSSRYNVLEHMDALNSLLKIFFVHGQDYCLDHDSPYINSSLGSSLKEFVVKMNPAEDEIVRVFFSKDKHDGVFQTGPSPAKSISNEMNKVSDFREEDQFWEVFKVKGKSVEKIPARLKEIIPQEEKEIYGVVFFETKNIFRLFHLFRGNVCKKGGEAQDISVDSLDHINPLNALGACKECSGHGMILKYDPLKMVKNPNLSLKDGALSPLKHSKLSSFKNSFLSRLKKLNVDIEKSFSKLGPDDWTLIWEGDGKSGGLKDILKVLEKKRYKSTVRIYLRGLQSEYVCEVCEGSALAPHAASRFVKLRTHKVFLKDAVRMTLQEFLEKAECFNIHDFKHAAFPVREIKKKLAISVDMGLGHLTGNRKVKSLSSGEHQRLLLLKYLSYQGEGSLFVLDEPCLGLGEKEQKSLFGYIRLLKKQGNTVLIVEHSDYFKKMSDHLVHMGPGAGADGGQIVSEKKINFDERRFKFKSTLELTDSTHFLRAIDVKVFGHAGVTLKIPLGAITWVNGDSGSGKSLYLIKSLAPYMTRSRGEGGVYDPSLNISKIEGGEGLDRIYVFDSSMSGVSSRSTVATYLDLAGPLRKYYANLPVSKSLDLKEGHFSSNSELGRCPGCEGKGKIEVDMSYFGDVEIICEDCKGMKIRPYLASIRDGEHSFYEAINSPLDLTFSKIKLTPKYRTLRERIKLLNLQHLNPDRKLNTLSGGERLRVKLLSSLQKKIKNSLLIFENISFGLSKNELMGISHLLENMALTGNTLVIIDQNKWFGDLAQFQLQFRGLGKDPKLDKIQG